ncbi:MAG: hypothetical protein HYZ75_12965 [Elusimicrobia bacterium]|nr:hypothetical protein [Elusimicrobiota bacterium]
MKSITIHGMDADLASRLERSARESGLSLNKTIKKLLAGALGISPAGAGRRRSFQGLCGKWSKEQAKEFRQAVSDLERVEPEDWA